MFNFAQKLLAFLLITVLLSHFSALAQQVNPKIRTYQNAFELYKRRYYGEAMNILDQIIPAERVPQLKAEQLKLKSILHYMLKDQQKAAEAFKQALALDDSVSVTNQDVFHPAIVKFFSEERRRFKGVQVGKETQGSPPLYHLNKPLASDKFVADQESTAASLPQGSASLQEPYDPIAAMGATPKELESREDPTTAVSHKENPSLSSLAKKSAQPKTTLTVLSNVKEARIFIDGILAGNVNEPLQVTPGVIDVEVNAPGFSPQTKRLAVDKDKQFSIAINLQKPKKGKSLAAKSLKKGAPIPKGPANKKVVATQTKPKLSPKKEVLSLFDEKLAVSKPAPDLASEFDKDVQSGSKGPVNPGVPMQAGILGATGFGQGMPQLQGGYVFPGQGSNAPIIVIQVPAAGAAAPSPYPSPYPAPVGGAPMGPQPPLSGPVGAPAPPPVRDGLSSMAPMPPGQAGGGPQKLTRREPRSHLLRLLPLGIPQYHIDQPIFGTIFALGQVAGVFLYWNSSQQADALTKKANATIIERNAFEETIQTPAERQTYADETDDYQKKQQKVVDQTRQEATMGLALAGGLWATSVICAYLYDPEPVKQKSKFGFQLLPNGGMDLRFDLLGTLPLLASKPFSTSTAWMRPDLFDLHVQVSPQARRDASASPHAAALLAIQWNL